MANLSNLKVSKISYESIRQQADTTSGHIQLTAHANTGVTAEDAPYLPRVVSDGEMDLDAQCRRFVDKTEYTYEQSRYFWNALMECVAEVLTDGTHTSVEFGYFRFALEIAGSVPSANSTPGPENAVWIAVYPSAELQAVAASIETMPNLDAQPFQIKEVFGADHVPNKVRPGETMLVMGTKLTMGGDGEKVELAKATVVKACTYVPREGDLNTRIRATPPLGLRKGKGYQLLITAKGKHGTDLVTIAKDNIEVLAGPPPTLTKVATSGKDGIVKGEGYDAEGTNLYFETGDSAKVKWTEGGVAKEQTVTPSTVTPTKLSFPTVAALDALPNNTPLTFETKIDGVTVTKATTLLPAPLVIGITSFARGNDPLMYNLEGTNLDAVTGFRTDSTGDWIDGVFTYEDATTEEVTGCRPTGGTAFIFTCQRTAQTGEKVKVTLTPNPARTDVKQVAATAECVVG